MGSISDGRLDAQLHGACEEVVTLLWLFIGMHEGTQAHSFGDSWLKRC